MARWVVVSRGTGDDEVVEVQIAVEVCAPW
jgi:hypothetical protein